MDAFFEKSLFQRHDLLIEIGKVEMAIDHLVDDAPAEQAQLRSRLESHMARLRSALDLLAA